VGGNPFSNSQITIRKFHKEIHVVLWTSLQKQSPNMRSNSETLKRRHYQLLQSSRVPKHLSLKLNLLSQKSM